MSVAPHVGGGVVSRRETFVCIVKRDDDGRVRSLRIDARDPEGRERQIEINSTTAARTASPLHDIVRRAGVSARAWSSSRPIELDQHAGAQAELLLEAVRPLRRADRIERVSDGIAGMSREEASYWHAKSHQPGGLRALRILFSSRRT